MTSDTSKPVTSEVDTTKDMSFDNFDDLLVYLVGKSDAEVPAPFITSTEPKSDAEHTTNDSRPEISERRVPGVSSRTYVPEAKTEMAELEDSSGQHTTLYSRLTNFASGTADWLKTTGSYAGEALGGFTEGAIQGSLIVLGVGAAMAATSMVADEFVDQFAAEDLAKDAVIEAAALSGASWIPRWK